MKTKLLIISLLISAICFGQSVPNTNTFHLTDVTAVTGGTSLSAAFTNSTDSYFDATYKGSKDRLSNFRNYTVACSLPTLISMGYSNTNTTSSSFKVSPNISSDGGCSVTERGAVAATTPNPTTSNIKVSNGTGTGQYDITFTGLSANTTYYVRPYAINSVGTTYGTGLEITITTLP